MPFLRSAFTVGFLTLISRILGFIRDQLIAFVLGTGPVAQAFFVAQRFPNLFRALFAEGAFNAAFVPEFTRHLDQGEREAHRFALEVFSALLSWLLLFSGIMIWAMPWVMVLIAPGFKAAEPLFQLTVSFTQICFPYLTLISLTALQSGVLNSLNRFAAAAAAPILLNLSMMSANALAWFLKTGNSPETGYLLCFGLLLSGVVQYGLLALACRRAGFPLFPRFPKLTPAVKRVFWLSIPGILSGGVMQINLVIATMIATQIERGVSYLYYADRLYQMPLGIIGVAIGVVLLPELSRKVKHRGTEEAIACQNWALLWSLFFMLPATLAFLAIPDALIVTLFEHGAFTRADTIGVSHALSAFALGLPAYAFVKVLQPGFYARQDTKTPMIIAFFSVGTNILGSFILSYFWGHTGIALASTLAAWVNALCLWAVLHRRKHYRLSREMQKKFFALLLSSVFLWLVLTQGYTRLASSYFSVHTPFSHHLLGLFFLIFGGCLTYFCGIALTRAVTLTELKQTFYPAERQSK